ncbi:MAG: GC-type dockerin domain-anchored protein [Phycisphaerales bacterium]|nr:GC-type dockerin domain-anchored protein [Phycisphaerales bacterium]
MNTKSLSAALAAALISAAQGDVVVSFAGPQVVTGGGGFTVTSPGLSGTLTGIIFHFDYSNSSGGSWAADMCATVNQYQWSNYDAFVNGATVTAAENSGAPANGNPISFTSALMPHPAPLTLTNQTVTVGYGNSYTGGTATMSNVTVTLVGVVPGTGPYPPSVSSGSTTPGSGPPGGSRLMKVTVQQGGNPASAIASVVSNLTTIGGPGAAAFHDDGLNGDVTAGDNVYSYLLANVTAGGTVSVTATDDLGRTGSGNISVSVLVPPHPALGPDVITWAITDVPRWGTNTTVDHGNAVGSITAYSVGTTSSNIGDYPVLWIDSGSYGPDFDTTQHPVISQNMYRLKSYGAYSRFEQLGQSWLKHGFVSTNSGAGCQTPSVWRPSMQNYQNIGGDALGVNCTDTYGGSLNGSQGGLGPKNVVNASLGSSPFTTGSGTSDATIRSRLQVPTVDVTAQPAGTRFYVDAFYVTADDAQFVRPGETVAVNALNNASWREIGNVNTSPTLIGTFHSQEPGIHAWKAADASVTQVNADHDDYPNTSTGFRDGDGNPAFPGTTIRSRFIVAAKATALGGGLWRYEYAVYNHNSDRSAQAFGVPMPVAATVTDVTFHAPMWHSGEPYSNAAWTATRSAGALTFSTQAFAQNPNANALRWGCLYNFGFTSNVAPSSGAAALALFKASVNGGPGSINANAVPVPTVPAHCGVADIGVQGGVAGQDDFLDNNDFIAFIDFFFAADGRADFGRQGGLPGADGQFNNNDFIAFIDAFFAGCP